MEDKIYSITLANGTVLSNLRLNGNNFISSMELTPEMFADNCAPVKISDGEKEEIHENMEFIQITEPVEGEYWLVLLDIPPAELAMMKVRSDIEYLAMMTDVEL